MAGVHLPPPSEQPTHHGQKLNWNYTINLIGEKVPDPDIHCCEICDLPILIYGRMLPCKHVFCYDCASKAVKVCPRCKDDVSRMERCDLGTIFLCTFGAPRNSHEGCRRTYLSQRDLQAHMNHRHVTKTSAAPKPSNSDSTATTKPLETGGRTARQAAIPSVRPPILNSNRGNLITIQLQGPPPPTVRNFARDRTIGDMRQ